MTAKPKFVTHTTPEGVARMAFLSRPSTKFNPDGVYSVKLILEADEAAPVIEMLDREIEKAVEKAIRENPKFKKLIKVAKPYSDELDEDGDATGRIAIGFKRPAKQTLKDGTVKTNKVEIIDCAGKPVKAEVWAGSKIMVRFFISPYFAANDKSAGVSLKMTHVMVTDLVSGGGGDADPERLGFGKVDGYKAKGEISKPAEETTAGAEDGEDSTPFDADNADF